jgi:hypothetical protein
MPPTLTSAIENAVKTTPLPQDLTQVPPTEETTEQPAAEPVVEETTQIEDPAEALEIQQGLQLLRAFKDPAQAAIMIDAMARQAGYVKTDIQTKQDVKEAASDIQQIFEQELGEEFKFLAPKFSKAINRVLETTRQENVNSDTADLRERLNRREMEEISNEAANTHVAISQEYFGTDDMPANVIQAMSQAMDQFPPTDPSMKPSTYYRKIFSLVAGEMGLTKKSTSRGERTTRNASDVPAKLSQQNRGVAPTLGTARKMSLDASIRDALAKVEATR